MPPGTVHFLKLKIFVMSFQLQKIPQSETIEVLIRNIASRQYKFSDNETTLDLVVMHGIAVHTDALAKSFTNNTIMPLADIKKGFLTLSNPKNEQPIKRLPLETLLQNSNFITYMEPRVVDIRKSFVDFPQSDTLALVGGSLSVCFTIVYEKYDAVKHANMQGL